ncbi:hypothetical protein Tco_0637008 [Tanacetum coccineum]
MRLDNISFLHGGFDIKVFRKVHKTGDISVLPDVPAGAVVQGLALGGGLEVPMGCNAWQLRKLNLACLNHILISCQALDV